jgi:hypothetical protein
LAVEKQTTTLPSARVESLLSRHNRHNRNTPMFRVGA